MMPNENRYLELLRRTDIMLSMLMSEIQDVDMRKQADDLLRSIEVETRTLVSPHEAPVPFIEYGEGWAKLHLKRRVTKRDRAILAVAEMMMGGKPSKPAATFVVAGCQKG